MQRHDNLINGEWVAGNALCAEHQSVEPGRRHRRVRAGRRRAGRSRRRGRDAAAFPAWSTGGIQARTRCARQDRQRDPGAQGRARHAAGARRRQDQARGHRRGRRAPATSSSSSPANACASSGELLPSVRPGIGVEITREPVGVVGLITPWNFPIAIPAWKIAPALAFGNCVVLKPADLVPGCAWALAEIIIASAASRRACSTS